MVPLSPDPMSSRLVCRHRISRVTVPLPAGAEEKDSRFDSLAYLGQQHTLALHSVYSICMHHSDRNLNFRNELQGTSTCPQSDMLSATSVSSPWAGPSGTSVLSVMSSFRFNFSSLFVQAWRPATVTSSLKTRKLNALRVPTCRYQLSCPDATRDKPTFSPFCRS